MNEEAVLYQMLSKEENQLLIAVLNEANEELVPLFRKRKTECVEELTAFNSFTDFEKATLVVGVAKVLATQQLTYTTTMQRIATEKQNELLDKIWKALPPI